MSEPEKDPPAGSSEAFDAATRAAMDRVFEDRLAEKIAREDESAATEEAAGPPPDGPAAPSPQALETTVRSIAEGFDRAAIPHQFVGGFALLAWGLERVPRDIDVLIHPADYDNALRIMKDELGFEHDGEVNDEGTRVEQFKREGAPKVDLLLSNTSGQEQFRQWAAECARVPVFGGAFDVAVASLTAIACRKASRMQRKDILDLQDLIQRFSLRLNWDDLERAGSGLDSRADWEKIKRAVARGERYEPPPPSGKPRTVFSALMNEGPDEPLWRPGDVLPD